MSNYRASILAVSEEKSKQNNNKKNCLLILGDILIFALIL